MFFCRLVNLCTGIGINKKYRLIHGVIATEIRSSFPTNATASSIMTVGIFFFFNINNLKKLGLSSKINELNRKLLTSTLHYEIVICNQLY